MYKTYQHCLMNDSSYSFFREKLYSKHTTNICFMHPYFAFRIPVIDALSVSYLTDDSRMRITLCKYILILKIIVSMKYKI